MKIILFIFVIILNGVSLLYLPKAMGKRFYLKVYGIIFGVALLLDVCAYAANIILEKRAANPVETITAPPSRVSANDTLYISVRKCIAQSGSRAAAVVNELPDELLKQAIISLGKGKHSAPEIAARVDDLLTGKVQITLQSLEAQRQETGLTETSKILISLLLSLFAIVFLGLGVQLFHWGIDVVLNFHLKYNAVHTGREPLKWILANRENIKTVITYVYFFGSSVMFYGIAFKLFED